MNSAGGDPDVDEKERISAPTSVHGISELDSLAKSLGIDRHRIRRFRNAFYKKQHLSRDALREIPSASRNHFKNRIDFHALSISERRDSRLDGASKLLFRTRAGSILESVILRIDSGRTTLCVSSQIGCAAKCAFCATGQMPRVISLSRDEILDQVVRANQMLASEGRRIRNVVFMGMGEPFHNEKEVFAAIDALRSPSQFYLSDRHIVISTVGIPEAMVRCAETFPRIHQALSLHSVNPEVRQGLMPIAKRYSLDELRRALEEVARIQQSTVMVEYILLEGQNASLEDADSLAQFLKGLRVHINLIPMNEVLDSAFISPPRAQREAFAQFLREGGFPVTLRYSLGADIAAACGQLVQEKSRVSDPETSSASHS